MPLRQSMASIIGIATNSQRNFQERENHKNAILDEQDEQMDVVICVPGQTC
jgi:hypothetical protein